MNGWLLFLMCLEELESVNTSRRCGKSQECDSKIWEERHFKLHGSDVHGSPNGKEVTRENGIWWIGSGENRRRDDDVNAPGGRSEKRKKKGIRMTLVGKSVIDEATIEGESGSDDRFYDAQVEVEEPVIETPATLASPNFISGSSEGTRHCRSRPLVPHWQTSRS
ncbi:hypothetical protein Dimus_025019 [Dionaea muscipula]